MRTTRTERSPRRLTRRRRMEDEYLSTEPIIQPYLTPPILYKGQYRNRALPRTFSSLTGPK